MLHKYSHIGVCLLDDHQTCVLALSIAEVGSPVLRHHCWFGSLYSQQAEHPIWLILMTICEKSGATVKILPLTYMYERSFRAKFQGHSDGGEHLPHNLRLKPE